jgi:hypothetical protein
MAKGDGVSDVCLQAGRPIAEGGEIWITKSDD